MHRVEPGVAPVHHQVGPQQQAIKAQRHLISQVLNKYMIQQKELCHELSGFSVS